MGMICFDGDRPVRFVPAHATYLCRGSLLRRRRPRPAIGCAGGVRQSVRRRGARRAGEGEGPLPFGAAFARIRRVAVLKSFCNRIIFRRYCKREARRD